MNMYKRMRQDFSIKMKKISEKIVKVTHVLESFLKVLTTSIGQYEHDIYVVYGVDTFRTFAHELIISIAH